MATGKSGYLDVTVMPQSVGKVRVYWREDYYVADNYSTITITDIKGYLWHRAAWVYVYASVKADSVTVMSNTNGAWMFSAAADTTLRSVYSASGSGAAFSPVTSEKIYHENDGKKTVTLTFTLHDVTAPDVGFNGDHNQSVSQSITLTDIPRASGVTAANGTIGSELSISISKTVSSFTHTLKYSFGSRSGTIVSKTSAATVKWTPPMELCSQIPNAASGTCTITCETYNGSTKVGETQTACKLTVPTSVCLTVSEGWAKVTPYNTDTVAAAMNAYVQGYSKAAVAFDETKISTDNAYGATIKSCRITCGGKQYMSPYRTDVLKNAGAVTVTATVVDSRGYAVNEDFVIYVEAYANPTLSEISIFRCDSSGEARDDGTYLSVTATAKISEVAGLNTFSMTLSVGSIMTVSIPSGETVVVGDALVLSTATYHVILTLTDALGNTAVYKQVIPTAEIFFHGRKGGRGAAFGKYSEEDDLLEVGWNIRGKKDLQVDGNANINGALSVGDREATRANLGLGAAAVEDVVPTSKGGTGGTTTYDARVNLSVPYYSVVGNFSTTIAVGGTLKLSENINGRDSILATLAYHRTVGRVVGGSGSRTIEFSAVEQVSGGVRMNVAHFNVADDGVTLSVHVLRRLDISSSGSISVSSPSMQFGTVCALG